MNKLLIIISVALFSACSPKEESPDGELNQSQIADMQESAEVNIQNIEYDGTYRGKIDGKDLELKLDGNSFEIIQSEKRSHGTWAKVNDATTIVLEPQSGKIPLKYLGYSDEKTWVVLSDSMTIPDNEQFLKRIPD